MLGEKLGGMGHVNESLVHVLALKKNWCWERTVVVHQAQNTLTQPRKAPCKVSTEKLNLSEQRIKTQDCSQTLQLVTAATAFLWQIKSFLQPPAIPLSQLCLGASQVSLCSITDTLTCTLATALPGPSPDTSPAWCALKDRTHTAGSVPAGDSLTPAE